MRRPIIFVAALALAACAHRFGQPGPGELRLSTNPEVRWETGGPHDLAVVLENVGASAITIADPEPAQAQVEVFEAAAAEPLCRREPAPSAGPRRAVDLAPRERRALVVRLEGCELPPGEYQYEAWWVVPEAGRSAWSGRLGPEHGRIVVQSSRAVIERPASEAAVAPPDHARTPGPAAPVSPRLRPIAPPHGAASLACVDRELARRGLNAYGDPAGTIYPEGPPVIASDVERQKMILERYPDLATKCGVPP